MIKLIGSAIEQAHFISLIAKRTGIREEIIWEDLKKVKNDNPEIGPIGEEIAVESTDKTQRERIEERLAEIRLWREELSGSAPEVATLRKEESELVDNLSGILLRGNLNQLLAELSRAEASRDSQSIASLTLEIQKIHGQMRVLEEKKKML